MKIETSLHSKKEVTIIMFLYPMGGPVKHALTERMRKRKINFQPLIIESMPHTINLQPFFVEPIY